MLSKYYHYNHWMPYSNRNNVGAQSVPLEGLPTNIQSCPVSKLTNERLLELAKSCNGNFIWICFANHLKFNNGWWRLNGVSNDENRIILTLERPNNNVESFEDKDIISIGPCFSNTNLEALPKETHSCPGIILDFAAFLQFALSCNGNYIWVCFTNDLKFNNGWWRLNGVSNDEKRIILTLERPDNNVENFEDKDIISIGPCFPYKKAEVPITLDEWVLDHFETTVTRWWTSGTGGSEVEYRDPNVEAGTRTFPWKGEVHWDGGFKTVDATLGIQLPDIIVPGKTYGISATGQSTINSKGLGFSRDAFLEVRIGEVSKVNSESNAENRLVKLQQTVEAEITASSPTSQITWSIPFVGNSGLNSVNDPAWKHEIIAVYTPHHL